MFKRKTLISLMLIIFLLVFNSSSAYAYNLYGYKWSSPSIKYYYDNYISTRCKTFIGTAVSTWNSQGTKISFSFSSTSPYVYCSEVSDSNATWDGITYISWGSNGYVTSATVVLNSGVTRTWNNDGALKSVAVHEFGHVLGLDENGTDKCIMNDATWGLQSRYETYSLTTPQKADVDAIKYLYP